MNTHAKRTKPFIVSVLRGPLKERFAVEEKPEPVDRYGLFPEVTFRALLAAERRRTERTTRPFMLALIDVGGLRDGIDEDYGGDVEGMVPLVASLRRCSREIDTKGWFYQDRVLGVIYPETDNATLPVLERKLKDVLVEVVGGDFHSRIGVTWYCFPGDTGSWDGRVASRETAFYPEVKEQLRDGGSFSFTRALDIAGGLLALLLFSPLLLAIAAAIRITTKGPVLFRQERIGAGGRRFTLLKFRSMYVDSEEDIHRQYVDRFIRGDMSGDERGKAGIYKITHDPRVTPVGRFLRRTSLDELPQFLNVLRGDMSLVGPRPPIPYELDSYQLWHRRRILSGKPGITGLWQVEGRSATSFDEMVRMDLRYLEGGSLLTYVKLVCKTPLALISTRGAY